MARTSTRPQATKPRYDDLDTFGRRDGSVSQRNAVYHGKKDPYWPPFATRAYRDAGWDATLIDEGLDQPVFDEEDWDLFDEEEFDDEEIDPDEFVDHGAYGTYRGVHTLKQGYGLDAVFGEGYLGGNCGFSVKTRP